MQKNMLSYLQNSALRFPLKTAIRDEDESVNFSELNSQAKAIAAHFQSLSVTKNRPVGVLLPKSVKAIKCFLGTLYNGCFYVPLDAKNPASRLEAIIKNLNLEFIVTDAKCAQILKNSDVNLIIFDEINLKDEDKFDRANYENTIDTDPLYIINTSGSTGTPKGVAISHKSAINYIEWACETFNFKDDLKIASQAPFIFDNSVLDIYLMLKTGSTLFLIPQELFTFPIKVVEYLEKNEINFIFWVPSVMANIAALALLRGVNLSLEFIIFAGEVMPVKTMNYFKSRFKNAVLANLYGPTETTVDCAYYVVDRDFSDEESLPIGYPCKNTDVFLLDENNAPVTAQNTLGELCVRGASLALGYYNDSVKTASAFTQNPLNLAYPERIYRTGDLAYYNERGELMYKGRKDFQIKHMGYRIELGEIETAALSLGGVDSACALYDGAIVLIYTSQTAVSQREILLNLGKILPKYMLPTRFVMLDEMPLNVNGKIDRNKLKELIKDQK